MQRAYSIAVGTSELRAPEGPERLPDVVRTRWLRVDDGHLDPRSPQLGDLFGIRGPVGDQQVDALGLHGLGHGVFADFGVVGQHDNPVGDGR